MTKVNGDRLMILQFALLLALMVSLPTVVAAQGGSATPGSGISGSAHDFTGGGVLPAPSTLVGLCTYCHTPHKALSTLLLWNHTLSTNTFSWDVPATTAGTQFPTFKGDTYKGATAKCLSCHDGSVAIGDIAWFQEASHTGGNALDTTRHNDGGEFQIATATGSMRGNHPVAMPFPFNNAKSTYNGVTTGSAATLTEWQSDPTVNNIRLFNDDGAGNITAGPIMAKTGIECSSCHDPHNKAAVDDLFLRGKLTGNSQASGYICMQCHIK